MGKGSKRRPGNQEAYAEAYAKIWEKPIIGECECGATLREGVEHRCNWIPPWKQSAIDRAPVDEDNDILTYGGSTVLREP
jgi:hypothetical protein